MARITSNNPLAQALDKRIRAVVDEALEASIAETVRNIVREELAQALGGALAAPAAIGARKIARPGRVASGRKPRESTAEAGDKHCSVAGCERPYRSQGYCAAHYQSARKHGWPMPAPANFVPPPSPPRGRPPRDANEAAD